MLTYFSSDDHHLATNITISFLQCKLASYFITKIVPANCKALIAARSVLQRKVRGSVGVVRLTVLYSRGDSVSGGNVSRRLDVRRVRRKSNNINSD